MTVILADIFYLPFSHQLVNLRLLNSFDNLTTSLLSFHISTQLLVLLSHFLKYHSSFPVYLSEKKANTWFPGWPLCIGQTIRGLIHRRG